MTRYSLIDTSKVNEAKTALTLACLHLRRGKRHMQKGLSAAGITALYDAVLFGMRYYITKHDRCKSFIENVDPWDASGLFYVLSRAGVFDDPQAFNRFSRIVERALWQESFSFDEDATLAEVEEILMKLGVVRSTMPPSTASL